MGKLREYFEILNAVSLFAGIDEDSLEAMLQCLNAEVVNYKKGGVALLAGDRPEHVGVVLSGQLHIVREDYEGNRVMVAAIAKGEVFAEAICCAGIRESPVSVVADADASVMLLRFDQILHSCPSSCAFHTKLIENMLGMIARKNLMLQNRMDIISVHSVREKVLRYLGSLAAKQGPSVAVPFNREELADFLCVERSALSHELSRMKRDGLIDYKKNRFELLL